MNGFEFGVTIYRAGIDDGRESFQEVYPGSGEAVDPEQIIKRANIIGFTLGLLPEYKRIALFARQSLRDAFVPHEFGYQAALSVGREEMGGLDNWQKLAEIIQRRAENKGWPVANSNGGREIVAILY